jgi:phytoene/squalene synthetase
MLVALADARSRYSIPARRCTTRRRRPPGHRAGPLRDFAELAATAGRSPARSGVACVAVYGSDDVERAATLGVALQLINIIRDVREDWELGASTCRRTS